MKRIGLFPGTFDPPTLGHLDIIRKARKICDHLIIAIALKPEKTPLFSPEERKGMLQKIAPDTEIIPYSGLIVDLAKEKEASFLIRGLRASSDFDMEFQMSQINKQMAGIETLFFMANSHYSQISSTLIREIAQFKGPLHDFVPKEIEGMILIKFS